MALYERKTHQKKRKVAGENVHHLFVCHEARRDVVVEPDYNPDRCPFCKADISEDL